MLETLKQHNESIQPVLDGLNQAANIITSTMGGAGKNVLSFENGNLTFTKDGVSVAEKIGFADPQNDIGAKLLINAANKTVKEVGDGTTLTSLFTQQFVNSLFNEINNGKDVNELLDETKALIAATQEYVTSVSEPLTIDNVLNVAYTSCKNYKLAELIKNIYLKAGLDANISLELSNFSKHTYVEHTEGLTFNEGFVNSGFGNQPNGNCVFEKLQFLIEDNYVNEVSEIADILDEAHTNKVPVVILAKGFSDIVIRYCLMNKQSAGLQVCLIKIPGYAESTKENLKDIACFLNSYRANRVSITPYEFTIFNNPNKAKIRKRVEILKQKAEAAVEEWEAKDYLTRASNLQQKSAIIYVGGITDKNAKEELDRIEDAVGAVKSSNYLGFVKGAGVTLYQYAQENQDTLPIWYYNLLKSPAYKILSNANLKLEPTFEAFNVRTKQMDNNIIDPAFVIISALENGFALAELLINTSYVLFN